jgi:subtilisin family serine protease
LLAALLALTSLPAGLLAQEATGAGSASSAAKAAGGAEFVPGEALVRFRNEGVAEALTEAAEYDPGMVLPRTQGMARAVVRFGGEGIVPGLRLVKVDPARTLEAIRALRARADVLYAEPNYVRHIVATPNDPSYLNGQLYGLQKIGAPAAWDTTTGSQSVVVGVIDQGIDVSHPDLAPNVWTNPVDSTVNGIDEDGNGKIDDTNGWDFVHDDRTVFDDAVGDRHATHVAGTIGARGNNGIGVVGVNWQVSLMSLKILDGRAAGSGGGGGASSQIIAAYSYALAMKQRGVNLRALNNSYGGGGSSQAELDAIRALGDAGILFAAAAGNDSTDNFSFPQFPANYDSPNVIAVASTDTADNISAFSNFSARLVSVGAPGSGIQSTFPGNNYGLLSGTSMATPHVTGAAALVAAAYPGLSVSQLRGVLAYNGQVIPALEGRTTTGRRINVAASLSAAAQFDVTPPAQAANFRVASQSGRSVTLAWDAPGDDGNSGTASDYDFFFVNTSGTRVLLPTTLLPAAAGTAQTASVNVPYRNFSGTIELRAYDDTGNFGAASVAVNVPVNSGSDPYVVTESAVEPLSTGGTRLALDGDDKYLSGYTLPFAFPYFGQQRTSLTVSTNGVLYFSTPARRTNGDADDVPSSISGLQGQTMIAGLWDDLMIDTTKRADSGVFVVQPDSTRVIFRFQGVTFYSAPRGQVNFEIELRSDGAIITRYAGTNTSIWPVVGLGGGEPSAYVVDSHTNEDNGVVGPTSLTNAATVTFAPRPAVGPASVAFAASSASVAEAAGSVLLTVTRSGDSQAAGAVEVRTVDDPAAVPCADTTTAPGVAFARCDYATTVETLTFAPGETSKSFTVPVINDAHAEPNETVQLALSNPTGNVQLGPTTTLALTIVSDDPAGAANPMLDASHAGNQFFVRQHYLDFLSREPEGGEPWTATLDNCPAGDTRCDRISVSAAFFGSPEFRLKGFFVFRLYRLSFGGASNTAYVPEYTQMVADMRTITGSTPAELYARKAAFTNAFAQRPEFLAAFPASLSNTDFVNLLMNRYGLTQIRTIDPTSPDTGPQVTLTRQNLIDGLAAGSLTRAQVVRAVADSDEVGAAESNRAFVAMQYYGYLRRTPEPGGYQAWLNTINANPNDSRAMVNGFMNSKEYRLRFGPVN